MYISVQVGPCVFWWDVRRKPWGYTILTDLFLFLEFTLLFYYTFSKYIPGSHTFDLHTYMVLIIIGKLALKPHMFRYQCLLKIRNAFTHFRENPRKVINIIKCSWAGSESKLYYKRKLKQAPIYLKVSKHALDIDWFLERSLVSIPSKYILRIFFLFTDGQRKGMSAHHLPPMLLGLVFL